MRVRLAYGRNGLFVDLPDHTQVIEPKFTPGLGSEEEAIRSALCSPIAASPLRERVCPTDKVVVVHTDITRATPNARLLPVILAELQEAGVSTTHITLLNGLGTHRRQTENELIQMLGKAVVEGYRCLQHDCYDEANLVSLGMTSLGHPVRVNRTYMEADFKILTGFVEPHFFAGFSGGPKAILPSLAGIESVYTNHGYAMIAHPKSSWGITEGNPIWEEMCEVALKTHPDFLVNVTLNSKREITGVFAGDMLAAHRRGCDFTRQTAMAPADGLFDIVITTNSGYPLDQNLYQSVKGMSAAARIVRPGGVIILAAACEDGLPDHGRYAQLLAQAGSPQRILEMVASPGFEAQDQWQVQIQAQIQHKADVYVYSENLSDRQITQALLKPCRDISALVSELSLLKGQRICALPEGPQVIPYLVL